jgi:DNA polymerase III gamma/tau subunit
MQIIGPGLYIVAGDDSTSGSVLALLEQSGVSLASNPDVYVRTHNGFGIDDAHDLRNRAQHRAVQSGMRTFIISMATITHEAQNALLKTFEEPPAGAAFFIIVPSPDMLLATIRSRAQMLDLGGTHIFHSQINIPEFLAATPAKRIEMLSPLLETDNDDGEKTKRNIGAILNFLAALEVSCEGSIDNERTRETLRTIYRARKYATDRGALLKSLLESVALLV